MYICDRDCRGHELPPRVDVSTAITVSNLATVESGIEADWIRPRQ